MQAKKKYQEVVEVRNMLQSDNEELKLKYQQKAQCVQSLHSTKSDMPCSLPRSVSQALSQKQSC